MLMDFGDLWLNVITYNPLQSTIHSNPLAYTLAYTLGYTLAYTLIFSQLDFVKIQKHVFVFLPKLVSQLVCVSCPS